MYIEEYEIVSLGTKYTGKNGNTEKYFGIYMDSFLQSVDL